MFCLSTCPEKQALSESARFFFLVFFIVSVHLTIMMHVFQFDKRMWLCALDSVNLRKSTKEDTLSFIFSFYTNKSGLFFDESNSQSDIWCPMRAIIILVFFLIVSISSKSDWNITNVLPVNIFSQFNAKDTLLFFLRVIVSVLVYWLVCCTSQGWLKFQLSFQLLISFGEDPCGGLTTFAFN